jgi:hypothetical protein
VIYNYEFARTNWPDIRFFIILFTINILYLLGLSLNFEKIPFFPFSYLLINLSIFAGGIIFTYLSVVKYIGFSFSPEFVILVDRAVPSFWNSGYEAINGPSIDMYSYMGLSLSGILCIFFRRNARQKFRFLNFIFSASFLIIISLMVWSSFYSSVALGARTPILVLFASISSSFLISNINVIKSRKNVSSRILIFALLFLCFVISIEYFQSSFFRIKDQALDVGIGSRLSEKGFESERYDAWQFAISHMWEYPLGGRQMPLPHGLNFVHNIWLDQLYDAGIVPMLLLIMFHLLQVPFILKILMSRMRDIVKTFVFC